MRKSYNSKGVTDAIRRARLIEGMGGKDSIRSAMSILNYMLKCDISPEDEERVRAELRKFSNCAASDPTPSSEDRIC